MPLPLLCPSTRRIQPPAVPSPLTPHAPALLQTTSSWCPLTPIALLLSLLLLFLSSNVAARNSGIAKVLMTRNLGGSYTSFNKIFSISWVYESTERIRFSVVGNYDGWVGVGFSYAPSMANTDFVVGFVNGTGQFDLQDRFTNPSDSHSFPVPDVELGGTDDLEGKSGKYENGTVSFSFVRRINTGDQFDKVIIKEEMYLLYAYGNVVNGSPRYHGSGNRSPVQLSFYPSFNYTAPGGVWKATWTFDPTFEYATFQITSTFDGWIGLGISETGLMASTDFVVGWVDATTGTPFVTDRFANPDANAAHGEPKLDSALGGVDDLLNITGSRTESGGVVTTTISFTRKCNTGDQYDVVISNRQINLLWAYGVVSSDGAMSRHQERGSAPINFQEGAPIATQPATVSFVNIHASLMMLAWSVFIVPFTILARYFKKILKTWFTFHWVINTIALLAISIAFILILIERAPFVASAHSVIGVLVVCLGILQGILGQVSNHMWFEGKAPAFWPDRLHWYIGRFLILLALVNVFLGLKAIMAENAAFILYSAYIGVTIIYIIYLEVQLGQSSELQSINDDPEEKNQKRYLILFGVYWLVSAGLVIITLILTLA